MSVNIAVQSYAGFFIGTTNDPFAKPLVLEDAEALASWENAGAPDGNEYDAEGRLCNEVQLQPWDIVNPKYRTNFNTHPVGTIIIYEPQAVAIGAK